ncbi:membrane protein [Streptomyces sulfonofaciens]|uniref:Membrane protein n=1 Tax=Streptomyces sulfonofaciens TaxID=68272 RepID=A0A919G2K7_9ACTN|nr:hypothetical protein [Streptomyces sulfonofaciens]GHH76306.1 membrane protein [Streptomyces sulfonofaciens]
MSGGPGTLTPAGSGPARWPAPPAAAARRPAALRWWPAALVAGPVAALFVLGYRRRWICDDGMIYLRPVRQVLAGHGPVFNAGERAESSTGAIWQWLLTLATWLTGADPAFLAVGVGLALSTAGYALALAATCRAYGVRARAAGTGAGAGRTRTRTARPVLLPGGVLVLLAVPPVWSYMTSGLESGLGTFWTGLVWWLLVRTRRGQGVRAQLATAFAFGLGWLVRPDLAVVAVCFLSVQWWLLRPAPGRTARLLGAAALLPAGYEVFRAGYYGVLLPLPAIAKEAGASDWGRGARYVQETLGPYWLWPALAVLAAVAGHLVRDARRTRTADGSGAAPRSGARVGGGPLPTGRAPLAVFLAPAAAGLLLALYVMRVGGDYMHARMILPALFLLLLPVLVVPATRCTAAAAGLLLVWVAAAVGPLRQPFDLNASPGTFNVRSSDVRYTHDHNPVRSTNWVRHWPRLPRANAMLAAAVRGGRPVLLYFDDRRRLHTTTVRPGAAYHVVMVGRHLGVTGAAVPLDGYVNDAWGLASPIGAHLALERWAWPGHEKFLRNEWIFADWAVRSPSAADLRYAGTGRAEVLAARRALGCGRLAELRDSVRAPLTPARFWQNLAGSWDRTHFRFARAPHRAVRELCGERH